MKARPLLPAGAAPAIPPLEKPFSENAFLPQTENSFPTNSEDSPPLEKGFSQDVPLLQPENPPFTNSEHSPASHPAPSTIRGNSPPLEGCPKGGEASTKKESPPATEFLRPPFAEKPAPPPESPLPEAGWPRRNSANYFRLPYNPALKARARALRQAGNLSEVLFWNQVKKGQFRGYDFDRQKVIGNYIVDFYCTNCDVVIEIDGKSHLTKEAYDAQRDAFLQSWGLAVIHIDVKDIFQRLGWVMEMLHAHPALLKPLPPRGNNRS